jgi:hypothetical protein
MAITRKISVVDANEAMEIVRSLRTMGLIQGKDFDFSYCPSKWDPISGHLKDEKHVIFTFHDAKWATWFSLKWS